MPAQVVVGGGDPRRVADERAEGGQRHAGDDDGQDQEQRDVDDGQQRDHDPGHEDGPVHPLVHGHVGRIAPVSALGDPVHDGRPDADHDRAHPHQGEQVREVGRIQGVEQDVHRRASLAARRCPSVDVTTSPSHRAEEAASASDSISISGPVAPSATAMMWIRSLPGMSSSTQDGRRLAQDQLRPSRLAEAPMEVRFGAFGHAGVQEQVAAFSAEHPRQEDRRPRRTNRSAPDR